MMQNKNIFISILWYKWKINKCIINMDSNNELKEIHIKNRTCYYFDDIIKIEDFNLDNILVWKYENILVYNISCKNLIAKPLGIRFNKIDEFVRVYDETWYFVLFGSETYDSIYNRIRYLINVKVVLHIFFLIIMQKSK